MGETLIHQRVAAARSGSNPTIVARVPAGWVVIGDRQVVRGYCLLLPDPVVPDLNALSIEGRSRFLLDMAALGDVLLEVTRAARINYEILGNSEPALHAHLFPRYDTEPENLRRGPIWLYDWSQTPPFDPDGDKPLVDAIARGLAARKILA